MKRFFERSAATKRNPQIFEPLTDADYMQSAAFHHHGANCGMMPLLLPKSWRCKGLNS
jgi:hypothetical protein